MLVVTNLASGPVGGAAEVQVKRDSPFPAVGERPPRVDTDTLASAAGDVEAIETRKPPDDMHEENFADVLGDKPVVLLMATPALCQTRVCGPVTDIAVQLRREYGDRATFIHQEVYEGNDVQKGLREPLREFALRTEPWLFTFTRDGGWPPGSRLLRQRGLQARRRSAARRLAQTPAHRPRNRHEACKMG